MTLVSQQLILCNIIAAATTPTTQSQVFITNSIWYKYHDPFDIFLISATDLFLMILPSVNEAPVITLTVLESQQFAYIASETMQFMHISCEIVEQYLISQVYDWI